MKTHDSGAGFVDGPRVAASVLVIAERFIPPRQSNRVGLL